MPKGKPGDPELRLGASKKRGTAAALDLKQLAVIPGFNPRGTPGDIDDLMASIKAEGLLSSLVVRPAKAAGKYEIVAGERRYLALKKLGYKDPVLCTVRTDLVGDNERSLAVAVAENSEDGRTNLTMLEIGGVVAKLTKKEWLPAHIARETGLNIARVRRALKLMETPTDVRERISKGTMSVDAGLEVAKLTPAMRKKLAGEISASTTAPEIRKLRKAAETETKAKAAAKGEPQKTAKGKDPKRSLTAWRSSTEKQTMLQRMCYELGHTDASDVGSTEYHELLGAIAYSLWDRGALDDPVAPELTPDKGDPSYAKLQKELAAFMAVVKAEAAKHTPDADLD